MATLKSLATTAGRDAASKKVAACYAEGMDSWRTTSMNSGIKSASEVATKLQKNREIVTGLEVLLEDAQKY